MEPCFVDKIPKQAAFPQFLVHFPLRRDGRCAASSPHPWQPSQERCDKASLPNGVAIKNRLPNLLKTQLTRKITP